MGSIAYDFLADSLLFKESEIQTFYNSLSDDQLDYILQEYRKHCLKSYPNLMSEIISTSSRLKVMSTVEDIPYNTIKQSSLYFDQFIIDDPLFVFAKKPETNHSAIGEYLGLKNGGIDRLKLVKIVRLLKDISPLVAVDFVKFLPLSYTFEPPKDIPFNIPINYYADALPREIMEFFRNRCILKSLQKIDGSLIMLDKIDLTPSILIDFEGLNDKGSFVYHHLDSFLKKTEDSDIFNLSMSLSKFPMDRNTWDAWIYQSINLSAKTVFDKIYKENIIAERLKATYLTTSPLISDLLTKNLESKETVESASATQFLNLELPFLDNIDISKLAQIRQNEAEIFTNFRINLEKQLRELRGINDPEELKIAQENIIHEIESVQINEINRKFKSLRENFVMEAIISAGGLVATVQTSGWSLLASAIAVANAYKTYKEYKTSIKENPSYLLWKVLR